jgi:hypothetical protein
MAETRSGTIVLRQTNANIRTRVPLRDYGLCLHHHEYPMCLSHRISLRQRCRHADGLIQRETIPSSPSEKAGALQDGVMAGGNPPDRS